MRGGGAGGQLRGGRRPSATQHTASCSTHRAPRAQGYVEAARLFEEESGTPPGVELSSITDRMEVRRAVQSGNMEEAIERANDINPEVGLPLWSLPCSVCPLSVPALCACSRPPELALS